MNFMASEILLIPFEAVELANLNPTPINSTREILKTLLKSTMEIFAIFTKSFILDTL